MPCRIDLIDRKQKTGWAAGAEIVTGDVLAALNREGIVSRRRGSRLYTAGNRGFHQQIRAGFDSGERENPVLIVDGRAGGGCKQGIHAGIEQTVVVDVGDQVDLDAIFPWFGPAVVVAVAVGVDENLRGQRSGLEVANVFGKDQAGLQINLRLCCRLQPARLDHFSQLGCAGEGDVEAEMAAAVGGRAGFAGSQLAVAIRVEKNGPVLQARVARFCACFESLNTLPNRDGLEIAEIDRLIETALACDIRAQGWSCRSAGTTSRTLQTPARGLGSCKAVVVGDGAWFARCKLPVPIGVEKYGQALLARVSRVQGTTGIGVQENFTADGERFEGAQIDRGLILTALHRNVGRNVGGDPPRHGFEANTVGSGRQIRERIVALIVGDGGGIHNAVGILVEIDRPAGKPGIGPVENSVARQIIEDLATDGDGLEITEIDRRGIDAALVDDVGRVGRRLHPARLSSQLR